MARKKTAIIEGPSAVEIKNLQERESIRREVTPRKDADGQWVILDRDGVETYIKNLPDDYAGGPILIDVEQKKSGQYFTFVSKKNGNDLPAAIETPRTEHADSPFFEQEREAGSRIAAGASEHLRAQRETAERFLNKAQEQMRGLESLIQNFGSLPQENRSQLLNELNALGLHLKINEADSRLLPENRRVAYDTLQRRVEGLYDQLVPSEHPKPQTKVMQKTTPPKNAGPDIEPWKKNLATFAKNEGFSVPTDGKSKSPRSTIPTDKTPWDPATGRYKDLVPVQEVRATDPSAGSSSFGEVEQIAANKQPALSTPEQRRQKEGRRLDTYQADQEKGEDQNEGADARTEKPERPQKPGRGGQTPPAEGVPEEVREQYATMTWDEFLDTITAHAPELAEPIQRFANAHSAYLVLEASEGVSSDETRKADMAVTGARDDIEQTARRLGLDRPTQEAIDRIYHEDYLNAAEELIKRLRAAYTASLDQKPDAPQRMNDALKALDRGRRKFLGRFPRERDNTPSVNELERKTRRQVWDARENELLADFEQTLQADRMLLEDSTKARFDAIRKDAVNAVFATAQWFHANNKDAKRKNDRDRAESLVAGVIANVRYGKARPKPGDTQQTSRPEPTIDDLLVELDVRQGRLLDASNLTAEQRATALREVTRDRAKLLALQAQSAPASVGAEASKALEEETVSRSSSLSDTPESAPAGIKPDEVLASAAATGVPEQKPAAAPEGPRAAAAAETPQSRAIQVIEMNVRGKKALILVDSDHLPTDDEASRTGGSELLKGVLGKFKTLQGLEDALDKAIENGIWAATANPLEHRRKKDQYRAAVAELLPHLAALFPKEPEQQKSAGLLVQRLQKIDEMARKNPETAGLIQLFQSTMGELNNLPLDPLAADLDVLQAVDHINTAVPRLLSARNNTEDQRQALMDATLQTLERLERIFPLDDKIKTIIKAMRPRVDANASAPSAATVAPEEQRLEIRSHAAPDVRPQTESDETKLKRVYDRALQNYLGQLKENTILNNALKQQIAESYAAHTRERAKTLLEKRRGQKI